jgi:hypothetical protein
MSEYVSFGYVSVCVRIGVRKAVRMDVRKMVRTPVMEAIRINVRR